MPSNFKMTMMDTQPILSLIREEAQQAAENVIAQARIRAGQIEEESIKRSAALHEQAREEAARGAEQSRGRAKSLHELEDRLYALSSRRVLIDRAFDEALSKLHTLPADAMEGMMLELIVQNAAGNETLQAGAVNDGFYTPVLIDKANQRLMLLGKPGQLKDAGGRVAGCAGVLLSSGKSLIHCTIEALMEAVREDLEAKAAVLLFEEEKR